MKDTKKIIQIGTLSKNQVNNPISGRVYSVRGLAPTLNTMGGGRREPMIIESYEYKTCKITKKE